MTALTDKLDVTDRAIAAGWTLPAGFAVRAWTEYDEDLSDPREKGEVYAVDIDEADYNHRTYGFCKHCAAWIHELTQAEADEVNQLAAALKPADEQADEGAWLAASPGDWARRVTVPGASEVSGPDEHGLTEARPVMLFAGLRCPGNGGGHELGDPLAVAWWRHNRWQFVVVCVEVVDADGHVWGLDTLGAVESGTFPVNIDPVTGYIESKEIDPLTDPHHPLPDMIGQVLSQAGDALAAHQEANPVIIAPPGH